MVPGSPVSVGVVVDVVELVLGDLPEVMFPWGTGVGVVVEGCPGGVG